MRGMARQVAQSLFFQCPCSLSKTRGASRRAITASSLLRRAALFVDRLSCSPGFPRLAAVSGAWLTKPRDSRRPSVSQLLAGGSYWPPGGAPAPPGCVLCEARPRAPHPAPPSDASRWRPSMSKTSWEYILIGLKSRTILWILPRCGNALHLASLIPAKAGIHRAGVSKTWVPAFAGTSGSKRCVHTKTPGGFPPRALFTHPWSHDQG